MRLAENTGCKKSPSGHHCTTLSGYILATKHVLTIGKKNTLNSTISSTCPHNMVNFGPLAAEICWRAWGIPANFSWFPYCSDVAHRRPTKLCTMFGSVLGWYTIYIHFWGLMPLTEFCQLQNSLFVQVLHSPILAVSLHGTRAAAVSQTL